MPPVDRNTAARSARLLVWGVFVKGVPRGVCQLTPCSVSLFDLAARFVAPTHNRVDTPRAEAVKDGARSATPKGLVLGRL
jgi:hypothetical protein